MGRGVRGTAMGRGLGGTTLTRSSRAQRWTRALGSGGQSTTRPLLTLLPTLARLTLLALTLPRVVATTTMMSIVTEEVEVSVTGRVRERLGDGVVGPTGRSALCSDHGQKQTRSCVTMPMYSLWCGSMRWWWEG